MEEFMRFAYGVITSAALAGTAFLLPGGVGQASAEEQIPTIQIPDVYKIGTLPEGLVSAPAPAAAPAAAPATAASGTFEKPAAINGTLYAVIAPTYSGNTSSFIRLFNGGSATAIFSVTVVGATTGINYGTASISIPVRASPQYSMAQLRTLANVPSTATDTTFSLYIQSAEATAGYQHVTFNSVNGFFENSSACKNILNAAIAPVVASVVLTNVHTSTLAANAYPSQIDIHNFFNASVNYRFTIIEAATGNVVSQTNVATAANTSYSMPFSFFENAINWQPTASQVHANIVVTDPSGAAPSVVLAQSINNTALSANINMTTACAVNAPSSSSGGGFGGGGISIGY
jgi:hypothetical protein